MQRDEIAVSFASLNTGGLYTSIDAGATWQLEPVEHARWKVVDFSANGTLFAAANGPAGLPNGLSRRNADGSWTLIGPEAGSDFESIFLDPDDPNHILAGGQASFADGSDAMIMRTTDGGATWTQVYDSGTNSLVGDIEMVGSVLLAIDVALSQNDGDILRSLDNGVTWTPVSVGFGTYPRRFHTVPDAPQTVLLADASYFLNAQNGLKKSTDAGQTWTLIGPPDRVGDVVVDPRNNQAVFALLWGDDNIVQRSLDGGSTFSQFSVGLEGLSGSKLTFVDGVTPHLLMAGAFRRHLQD